MTFGIYFGIIVGREVENCLSKVISRFSLMVKQTLCKAPLWVRFLHPAPFLDYLDVAQSVEWGPWKLQAAGSSPAIQTIYGVVGKLAKPTALEAEV